MLCERCQKNEATYFIKEVINGVGEEHHYCATCMEANDVKETLNHLKTPFSMPFSSFFSQSIPSFYSVEETPKAKPVSPCPNCYLSYGDLMNRGRFGCAECYDHFADVLPNFLKQMQAGTRHIGKVYAPEDLDDKEKEMRGLNKKLEEAIREENYELAAKYRDQLKQTKEEGGKDE